MGSDDLQACSPGGAVGVEEGRGDPVGIRGRLLLCSEFHMHESALRLICFLRIIVGFESFGVSEGAGSPLAFVGNCLLCSELHVPEAAFGPSGEGTPIGVGEGLWCMTCEA